MLTYSCNIQQSNFAKFAKYNNSKLCHPKIQRKKTKESKKITRFEWIKLQHVLIDYGRLLIEDHI